MKWGIMAIAGLFLGLFLGLPLALILSEAFGKGWWVYAQAIEHPDTLHAIGLTLKVALIAVVCNTVFGIASAWLLTHTSLRAKPLWMALIDLPFSISPVVAGLMFVLVFGRSGWLGPWLLSHGLPVIFTPWGIGLATCFVTLPFVSRELIPLMQTQGTQEEEAATLLGASGWQVFCKITLPKIKWGVLYGVLLAAGRAVGEFGAVSVVSGHIVGKTNTLSLHIERLYNEYQFHAAFSVSTLLVGIGILSLLVHPIVANQHRHLSKGKTP